MSFVAKLQRAREVLEQQGRLSEHALGRELEVGGDELEELVEELVDIQQVAYRDGKALVWGGASGAAPRARREESARTPPAPDSYTPKHLADKILGSRAALEGERKQVTVLFVDVKGSMELAEQVDPEEWHRILDRFFHILNDGVHRFEGTVNQYTGDGIMALFGAPIMHEDHAQRACFAALHLAAALQEYAGELKREQGLHFAVRMGVNSGDVVVGRIGDDLRMDYTALGHTVGLAQRMEQLADPGKAYLTDATAKLVAGYFELRDLGAFRVKGVSEPVPVHELVGQGPMRTRLDVSRARGLTRFVGRGDEMRTLEDALESAMKGDAQVVAVVGDAGVGKSRLCWEFVQRCRARDITVYEGHGVPHGKALPLLPLFEYLRAYFGIRERDTAQGVREKVAGKVLLLDAELADALPLLFDFLGVPDPSRPASAMDPEARQLRLLEYMAGLLRSDTQRQPICHVLEDLHWFDAGTEAFLRSLVEAIPGTRTLVVVNFRPEYRSEWLHGPYARTLALAPLHAPATAELLQDLLGTDSSVAGLASLTQKRTAGNAFFIEEVIQGLIEEGSLAGGRGAYRLVKPIEQLGVPPTVQALLAARVDRLGAREKDVLQTAAVIGRHFAEPLLASVVELDGQALTGALQTLEASEFVYQDALYPVAEYAFKHPLTQEVALGSQLQTRRRRLHAAVAGAIEKQSADTLDERAALLAHHWEQAHEPPTAARWHARAAGWVASRDTPSSLGHWRRVRELLAGGDETPDRAALLGEAYVQILFLSWRTGIEETEWRAVYDEGRALAERTGDRRLHSTLLSARAAIHGFAGEHHREREMLEEALGLVRGGGDVALEASLYQRLGWAYGHCGDLGRALEWTERGIDFCGEDRARAGHVSGYGTRDFLINQRGFVLMRAGRMAEADRDLMRAIALASEVEDWWTVSSANHGLTLVCGICGDFARMYEHARAALAAAERISIAMATAFSRMAIGQALMALERYGEALDMCERADAVWRQAGTGRIHAFYVESCLALAEAAHRCGRTDRAAEARQEACRVMERLPDLQQGYPHLLVDRARVRLLEGSPDACRDAEHDLATATELAREGGFRATEPAAFVERANLARLRGDETGWRSDLQEAQRLFDAIGAPRQVERIERLLKAG